MIKVKTLTGDWSCRSWVYSTAACLAPNMQQQANSKRKQNHCSVFLLQLSSDHNMWSSLQLSVCMMCSSAVSYHPDHAPCFAVLQARR